MRPALRAGEAAAACVNFPDGSSYSPKVSDLLIPETLGYSYGIPGPQVATGPNVLSLNSKVNTLFLKSGASAAVGVQTFRAENAQPARATQPLEVPVKVTPALISAVANAHRWSTLVRIRRAPST